MLIGFKNKGRFYTEKEFIDQTFSLSDFFLPKTISMLKDSKDYKIKETLNIVAGRCHTICNLHKYYKKIGPSFLLKTNLNLLIFAHMEGDEFWLNGLSDFPINIAYIGLDTSNKSGISSALVSLSETESSYLSKADEVCLEYAKGLYLLFITSFLFRILIIYKKRGWNTNYRAFTNIEFAFN